MKLDHEMNLKNNYKSIFFYILLLILCAAFFYYTAIFKKDNQSFSADNLPISKVFKSQVGVNYYSELSRSFVNFKTYFLGPYDRSVQANNDYPYSSESFRGGNVIQDASFYKDKYFLYFGPLPTIPYISIYLLTEKIPSDHLVGIMTTGFFLIIFVLITTQLNKENLFKKDIDFYILIYLIFFLLFFNPYSYTIYKFPSVHNYSRLCAIFFSFVSFYFLFKNDEIINRNIIISNLFAGFAFFCKYNFIIFYFLVLLLSIFRIKFLQKKTLFFSTVLLFLLFLISHFFYNYIRFDSFFEFGMKYQVNGQDFIKNGSALHIPTSLKSFVLIVIEKLGELTIKGPNVDLSSAILYLDNNFVFFKPHGRFYMEGGMIGLFWVFPSIVFLSYKMFISAIKNLNKCIRYRDFYVWIIFYLFNILMFMFVILTSKTYVSEVLFSFIICYLSYIKTFKINFLSKKEKWHILISFAFCFFWLDILK